MSCPEKETLQRRCTESLNAYERALNELGVVLDPNVGDVWSRLLKGFSDSKAQVKPQI